MCEGNLTLCLASPIYKTSSPKKGVVLGGLDRGSGFIGLWERNAIYAQCPFLGTWRYAGNPLYTELGILKEVQKGGVYVSRKPSDL